MYTVFQWIEDGNDRFTIEHGYFRDEQDAQDFRVFYALAYRKSLDDFCVGYSDVEKFIGDLKEEYGI